MRHDVARHHESSVGEWVQVKLNDRAYDRRRSPRGAVTATRVTAMSLGPRSTWSRSGWSATFGLPGLLEWHLGETFGVQVWSEPDRAGHSSMVLDESDVDATAARLNDVGVVNDGPQEATTSRILALTDPDGNRLVFTGPLA